MKAIANDDFSPEKSTPRATPPLCLKCGLSGLQPRRIETAFWRDGGLIVIRNIPAMVCPTCGEEFVGDQTAIGLDQMRSAGFTPHAATARMMVPVFDYCHGREEKE